MAFIFKQGRFSTCTVLFWLSAIFLFAKKEIAASDSIIKYDCRRAGASCGVSQCNVTDGSCECGQAKPNEVYDYACQSHPNTSTNSCNKVNTCSNHGYCNATDTCKCNEGYYGKNCSMTRVQVACTLTHMKINVNLYDNNGVYVYVLGEEDNTTCLLQKVTAASMGFDEQIEGFFLDIPHNDSSCGNANHTTDETQPGLSIFTREFQIQYIKEIKTLEDPVIKAVCEISGNEKQVTSGRFSVNGDVKKEEVDVTYASISNVTLTVEHEGNLLSGNTFNLGDELDLKFQMISLHNAYKDFYIKRCTAQNSENTSHSITLLDEGCPIPTLRSLFMNSTDLKQLKSDHTTQDPVITLKLKAFMFTQKSPTAQIAFNCTVSFCNDQCNLPNNCAQASPSPVIGRKRRSAINEADVSAVVTVVDPLANIKELRNTNQMEQCLQEPSFIATVATCGAVILILMIICIILATKLMTRRQKKASDADSGYPGPAFALRIPRLSVSNSREHFYPHD